MSAKESKARIKINKLLEDAGWRFFDVEEGPANIILENNVKIKEANLDVYNEGLRKQNIFIIK